MIRQEKSSQALTEEKEQNQFGLPGIGIPAELLFNEDFNSTEKIIFGFIRNLAQTRRGCWASNRWLGKLVGVGTQTISNAITRLADAEYLLVEYFNIPGGKQVRQIHINPEIAALYRPLVEDWHNENISSKRRPATKKIVTPPIKKLIGPYKNIYNKYDNKIETNNISLEYKKTYSSMTKQLSEIIRATKKVQHSSGQLSDWHKHIERLIEKSLSGTKEENIIRVQKALDWYAQHAGEPYVPVIESGISFYSKFTKLEDAIEREKKQQLSGANKIRASIEGKYSKIKTTKIGEGDNG